MAINWELDFYSRPILDENQKRLWELLICDRDRQFEWVKVCPPDRVNSTWLAEQLQEAIAASGQAPQKVRFFRPSMGNMILRGCKQVGLNALSSRRLFTLASWLQERMEKVYPQEPGFQAPDPQPLPLRVGGQITVTNPLPDALRGERWLCASLTAADLLGASEWSMDFGELFTTAFAAPETIIPGVIILSGRATPLAAWMAGVDPVFLKFERNLDKVELVLEASGDARWSLARLQAPKDQKVITEGESFEQSKQGAQGVHFLAVQRDPNIEHFAGFWLLKEV